MECIDTKIKDVKLIKPKIYGDSRGFFLETYQKNHFKDIGIPYDFIQDNHSRSKKNTLRGLHYQLDKMQGKLVRVSNGCVYDVAVDMRKGSPTFKEHVSFILSDENQFQLFIPPGFAHGFCVISDEADFEYKCTEFYNPNSEVGVMWDDPDLDIDWPISNPMVSDKDNKNFLISEIPNELIPKY
tara:strand:- start:211 stop:762 length:552 start_codon:yes stop_codon:yes gene_type:complete